MASLVESALAILAMAHAAPHRLSAFSFCNWGISSGRAGRASAPRPARAAAAMPGKTRLSPSASMKTGRCFAVSPVIIAMAKRAHSAEVASRWRRVSVSAGRADSAAAPIFASSRVEFHTTETCSSFNASSNAGRRSVGLVMRRTFLNSRTEPPRAFFRGPFSPLSGRPVCNTPR